MQEYRAYIVGPDGHVQNRIDLRCADDAEAIRLAKQLLMVATWSYGNWIERSGRLRHKSRVSEIVFTLAVHAP